MRLHLLVHDCIHVFAQPFQVHLRASAKDLSDDVDIHHALPTKRPELSHRNEVAGQQKTPSLLKGTHDTATAIA